MHHANGFAGHGASIGVGLFEIGHSLNLRFDACLSPAVDGHTHNLCLSTY